MKVWFWKLVSHFIHLSKVGLITSDFYLHIVFENKKKVSFASYVYILSGQSLLKMPKNGQFWRVFKNLKLGVKQCYHIDIGHFKFDKKWLKCQNWKETFFGGFQTMCMFSWFWLMVWHWQNRRLGHFSFFSKLSFFGHIFNPKGNLGKSRKSSNKNTKPKIHFLS